MSQSLECRACGSENSLTSETCEVCSAKLDRTTSQAMQEVSQQEPYPLRRARPTLKIRLVAGFWFSITVGIVALSYLYLIYPPLDLHIFLALVFVPALIAGLCGSVLGAPILLGLDPHPILMAAIRGIATFAICFGFFIVIMALRATLASGREFSQFVLLVLWAGVFWGLNKVVGVALLGAGAGIVLYRCRRLFA